MGDTEMSCPFDYLVGNLLRRSDQDLRPGQDLLGREIGVDGGNSFSFGPGVAGDYDVDAGADEEPVGALSGVGP